MEVNRTVHTLLFVNPQSDLSAGFGFRDCDDSNEIITAFMDAVMKDENILSDCYIRRQAEGMVRLIG